MVGFLVFSAFLFGLRMWKFDVDFGSTFWFRLGTPSDPPSGVPLPDKKTLELILDKLQK